MLQKISPLSELNINDLDCVNEDILYSQTNLFTCLFRDAISLPGDNGFDPLGLAEDPENLRWFVQAELVNGRWAMLGVAGMLLPEVFTSIGIINVPKWYDAGKEEYFASSSTLFVIEFILFHYVEIRRWQDIKNPGSVNQDPIFKQYSLPAGEVGYPGGIFNPLNFAPTLEAKEKEIANGKYF